jgi:hypothetical protein
MTTFKFVGRCVFILLTLFMIWTNFTQPPAQGTGLSLEERAHIRARRGDMAEAKGLYEAGRCSTNDC